MVPAIIRKTESIEKKAASVLLILHDSNFLASGKRINEISKAILSGISIGLANTRIANTIKTVAIAKNSF